VHDREGECLDSIGSIESAAVAVRLLLIVFAGFNINDGR
jgi:hypothetical protein